MNKNILFMTAIFTMLLIPFSISYILITYVKSLENENGVVQKTLEENI